MSKSQSRMMVLLIAFGFLWVGASTGKGGWASDLVKSVYSDKDTDCRVNLFAAHKTISWDARDVEQEKFNLPVLYLHRERAITGKMERTLEIRITGLTGGEEVDFEIISRHADISTGNRYSETQRLNLPALHCTSDNPCVVQLTFNPQTTPSDFYTLRVRDTAGYILWENPYDDRPDFVMLDTWDVAIDDYTVRIIYAALFPFDKGKDDFDNRLAPDEVADFIQQQFVPIITETWYTQFNTWGLGKSIHPAWDSDNILEIIVTNAPLALFGDIGLRSRFIGNDSQPTPECRLWWASSNNSFQAYSTLEDATKALYSHEFFHLVQRNILLQTERPEHRWMSVFIEAQGKFAPSVQYPDMEVRRHGVRSMHQSDYLVAANRFLALRLNSSYRDLERDRIHMYDTTLYWRFLYEQNNAINIVKTALIEMTKHYEPDIVPAMKVVMNQTFAENDGPFESFEESLIAFARANYALHLRDGRCKEIDFTKCGGFYYDPSGTYQAPPLEAELSYDGSELRHEGALPASYGMDFIEITLENRSYQQPLIISVEGDSAVARFNIQLWKVKRASPKQYAMTAVPEVLTQQADGIYSQLIPGQDTLEYDKLVLIITRLDAQELTDPQGKYTVKVQSEDGH